MAGDQDVALTENYVLKNRYKITQVIGMGGFGITYKAFDNVLQKNVAIKEFFPAYLANRMPNGSTITIYTSKSVDEYNHGLQRFMQEARDVSKFSAVQGIVTVHDFFQDNNTAYIVMEYLNGCTLSEYAKIHEPDESFISNVLFSIMDSLEAIHREGIIHRDISPDNIFICDDGTVKIIDFGAAKQEVGNDMKTMSVVLKQGYAPIEQYSKKSKIGPWTDIYALGATMYRLLTGRVPEESLDRVNLDELVEPKKLNANISEALNITIMKAMAVNKTDRFQNIAEMRNLLLEESDKPTVKLNPEAISVKAPSKAAYQENVSEMNIQSAMPNSKKERKKKKGIIKPVLLILFAVCLVSVGVFATSKLGSKSDKKLNGIAGDLELSKSDLDNLIYGADNEGWVIDGDEVISVGTSPSFFLFNEKTGDCVSFDELWEKKCKSACLNSDVVSYNDTLQYIAAKPGVSTIVLSYNGKLYAKRVCVIDDYDESKYDLKITADGMVDKVYANECTYENPLHIDFYFESEDKINTHTSLYHIEENYVCSGLGVKSYSSNYSGKLIHESFDFYVLNEEYPSQFLYVVYDNEKILGVKYFSIEIEKNVTSDAPNNIPDDSNNTPVNNPNLDGVVFSQWSPWDAGIPMFNPGEICYKVGEIGYLGVIDPNGDVEPEDLSDFYIENQEIARLSDDGTFEVLKPGVTLATVNYKGTTYGGYISVLDVNKDDGVNITITNTQTGEEAEDVIYFDKDGNYIYNGQSYGKFVWENQFWLIVNVSNYTLEDPYVGYRYDNCGVDAFLVNSTWFDCEIDNGVIKFGYGGYPNGVNGEETLDFFLIDKKTGEVQGFKQIKIIVE